jgi:hypothetical protein
LRRVCTFCKCSAIGNFYEGIMVTGETTDKTDDLVQENIVAVGYKNLPK